MLRHRYRVSVKTQFCMQRLGCTQDRVATKESICRRTLVVSGRCRPVPSDALTDGNAQGRQRTRRSEATVLEVRRSFIPSRLSSAYLAAAYLQVVPSHRRRMAVTELDAAPVAEASRRRAAGESRGIRDV